MEKLYLKAKIELHDETKALKDEVASVISLPKEGEKQIDLQYFSAAFAISKRKSLISSSVCEYGIARYLIVIIILLSKLKVKSKVPKTSKVRGVGAIII